MTLEKYRTENTVFDSFTIKTVQKLESEGFFNVETLSPLFVGKESNVFIGENEKGHVIVKIYRLETCDFLKMYQYLRVDERTKNIKRKRRDIIFAWVKREYRNLNKARDLGVKAPQALTFKNNVIVMEMIGEPANKIKDDIPENPQKFYDLLAKEIKKLSKELVHADLSQFNILNFNEKPVLIDFSQSLPVNSPNAKEYFERDLTNVNNFFKKIGTESLKSKEDFLK